MDLRVGLAVDVRLGDWRASLSVEGYTSIRANVVNLLRKATCRSATSLPSSVGGLDEIGY